jgi:predicted ATP-grasp superfamily ATP-dependent carboligase
MVRLPPTQLADLEHNLLALAILYPLLILEVDVSGMLIKQVPKTNAQVKRLSERSQTQQVMSAPQVEPPHPLPTTTRPSVIAKASAPRIPHLIPTMSP